MAFLEIIVVNWNGLNLLKQCIESLQRQTCGDFTMTVVDNGSNDGSVAWLQTNHPSVKLIPLDDNTGFARANNLAALQSNADYLLLLNNDIEVEPNFIDAICCGLQKHPDADMASVCMIQHHRRDRVDNLGMDWTWVGVPRQLGHGFAVEKISREEKFIFGPSAGAGVYRRDLFLKLGGFDETFFAYCEDSDLNLRAQTLGAKCVFLPEAVCHHHGSATGDRFSSLKYYLIQRNQSVSFFKNLRLCHLGRYLLPYLSYCLFRGVQSLVQGRLCLFLRAKSDALRMLRGLSARRIPKN